MRLKTDYVMTLIAEKSYSVKHTAELANMQAPQLFATLRRGTCGTAVAGRIAAALDVPVSTILEP